MLAKRIRRVGCDFMRSFCLAVVPYASAGLSPARLYSSPTFGNFHVGKTRCERMLERAASATLPTT